MKMIQTSTDYNYIARSDEPTEEPENGTYIGDLTKIEEEGDYDWYHFYTDTSSDI